MISLLILGWLVCGIGGAGFLVAEFRTMYFQIWQDSAIGRERAKRNYPIDIGAGLFIGLLAGPFWLIGAFIASSFGRHGWTLLPPKE